jgi:hypothetical protein
MLEYPAAPYGEVARATGYSRWLISRITNSLEFRRRHRTPSRGVRPLGPAYAHMSSKEQKRIEGFFKVFLVFLRFVAVL